MQRSQVAPRPDVARATPAAARVKRRAKPVHPPGFVLNPNLPPEWNMPLITPAEAAELNARAEHEEAAFREALEAEREAYTLPVPALLPGWVTGAAADICYHTGLKPRAVPFVAAIIARYSPLTRESTALRSHPGAGRPLATA